MPTNLSGYQTYETGPTTPKDATYSDLGTSKKYCLDVAVQTGTVTGTLIPSGLDVAADIAEVSVDSTSWTELVAGLFATRKAICIQNQNNVEMKINYDNTTVGYVGIKVPANSERFYDIVPGSLVKIYGKSSAGTITVTVEEIS